MSKITKWLGAIAGLLIIAEVAGPTLHGLFFQQLEQNQQQLATVSRQLRIKELALRQAESTTRKFLQRAQLNLKRMLPERVLPIKNTCCVCQMHAPLAR